MRALTRDLLATDSPEADEEQILPNVQSFEVTFYDGQNWQESWPVAVSGSDATLPQAIRVRVQQAAASEHTAVPAPLEILVPITTEALNASTTSTTGTTQ